MTIGHISDSDELKCYFNSHVCTELMYPHHPFQTHDPDAQHFLYYFYAFTFVWTSSQM